MCPNFAQILEFATYSRPLRGGWDSRWHGVEGGTPRGSDNTCPRCTLCTILSALLVIGPYSVLLIRPVLAMLSDHDAGVLANVR